MVARQQLLRSAGTIVLALTYATTSQASVIQPTVILPPVSGTYALGGLCVSALGRCTQNAMVSDFEILTSSTVSGNQVVHVNAVYSAVSSRMSAAPRERFLVTWQYPAPRSSCMWGVTPP